MGRRLPGRNVCGGGATVIAGGVGGGLSPAGVGLYGGHAGAGRPKGWIAAAYTAGRFLFASCPSGAVPPTLSIGDKGNCTSVLRTEPQSATPERPTAARLPRGRCRIGRHMRVYYAGGEGKCLQNPSTGCAGPPPLSGEVGALAFAM